MQNGKYHPKIRVNTHCEINQIDQKFILFLLCELHENLKRLKYPKLHNHELTKKPATVEQDIIYGQKTKQKTTTKNHNTSLMSTSRLTKSLYFMKIFRPSERTIIA